MRTFFLPLLAVVALAGCVSPEQRAIRRAYIDEFRSYGLPRQLESQIENTDPISPTDVAVLSRRGVPPELIISYLGRAPAEYRLSLSDINRLRADGVNDRVIDAMLTIRRVDDEPRTQTTISYGIGGSF